MLPMYLSIGKDYPFYLDNILTITLAITFIRYIFLLQHHWIAYSKWIKAVFIFIPIPILFFLLGFFYDFQSFYDERGIESVMTHISLKKQTQLSLYIRTQLILFWAAAFITNLILPFRMILSIWRNLHKGTH